MVVMTIYFISLSVFMLYQSVSGYFYFKANKDITLSEKEKLQMYQSTILVNIIMAVIPVVIVLATTMELSDIGIAMPNHKVFEAALTNPVNFAIIGLSLMIILLLVLDAVYTIIKYTVYSNKQIKLKDKPMELPIKMLQPLTMKEKKIWTWVALNAGITEEIVYRGTLIYVFGRFFPQMPILGILIIVNLLFGFGHAYQGVKGVLKTAGVGFLFSVLYISTGSLLLSMVVHFMIDYSFQFLSNTERIEQKNGSNHNS